MTRASKNGICLLTCFSNINLMLGCCVFKNFFKKKSASVPQLKRHIISSTYHLYKIISHFRNEFPITHKKISQKLTEPRREAATPSISS